MIGSYHNGFAPRDDIAEYPQLWTGCVGAWCPSLGPTGAVLRDWSGRTYHGTLTNMEPGTDWIVAPSNGGSWALQLDGVSEYVSVGTIPQVTGTTPPMSLVGWAYVSGSNVDLEQCVVSVNGPAGVADTHVALCHRDAGNVVTVIHYAGDWTTTVSFPVGQWVHVAYTFDGATESVYVNGKFGASRAKTFSPPSNSEVFIGEWNDRGGNHRYWNGMLDDIRIYNRALSAFEIALLCSGGRGIAYQLYERRRVRSAGGMLLQRRRMCA